MSQRPHQIYDLGFIYEEPQCVICKTCDKDEFLLPCPGPYVPPPHDADNEEING